MVETQSRPDELFAAAVVTSSQRQGFAVSLASSILARGAMPQIVAPVAAVNVVMEDARWLFNWFSVAPSSPARTQGGSEGPPRGDARSRSRPRAATKLTGDTALCKEQSKWKQQA